MELKSFVTQALVEIVQGVKDAQEQLKSTGASINPDGLFHTQPTSEDHVAISIPGSKPYIYGQIVEFDVSVTASEKDAAQGGVGIQVASITIGAALSGTTEEQSSVVSRLKFSVPLFLPQSK